VEVKVMEESLAVLCGRISLTEGKNVGITINEGEIADLKEKGARCLVWSNAVEKKITMEAFKDLLSKLWKPVWRVVFKELKENLWRFEFS
jgi:hypothetical protein